MKRIFASTIISKFFNRGREFFDVEFLTCDSGLERNYTVGGLLNNFTNFLNRSSHVYLHEKTFCYKVYNFFTQIFFYLYYSSCDVDKDVDTRKCNVREFVVHVIYEVALRINSSGIVLKELFYLEEGIVRPKVSEVRRHNVSLSVSRFE